MLILPEVKRGAHPNRVSIVFTPVRMLANCVQNSRRCINRLLSLELYRFCSLSTPVKPIEQILLILAGRRSWVQTDQIRRSEGLAVQLGRQASPEALQRHLGPMGQQGLALDRAVRPDIEGHRRGLRAGATGPLPVPLSPTHIEAGGLERGPQGLPLAVIDLGNGIELGRRSRGAGLRIRPRISGGMERREAHLVAHDVVRVGIATTWGFGDDHEGAQHTNNPHEPACCLARVSLDERVQVLIGGCPRHPRIPVAEQPQLRDPEQGAGLTQLPFPNGP